MQSIKPYIKWLYTPSTKTASTEIYFLLRKQTILRQLMLPTGHRPLDQRCLLYRYINVDTEAG